MRPATALTEPTYGTDDGCNTESGVSDDVHPEVCAPDDPECEQFADAGVQCCSHDGATCTMS